jgi:hypothetical protein
MVGRGWLVMALVASGCQRHDASGDTGSATEYLSPTGGVAIQSNGNVLRPPPAARWTEVDDALVGPVWTGDYAEGSVYAPLWRGASSGIEDFVFAPPGGDCSGLKGTVRIDWSQAQNRVHYLLKLRGLPLHPSVHRVEGVTWFPDPFHQAPKDIEDGEYRFWTIFTNTRIAALYYDAQTLDLLGSQFEFPSGPPPGSIPITLPVAGLFATVRMRPDNDGFIIHEYDIRYDRVTVEGGTFSVAYDAFPPLNLCQGFPPLPTLGQQRPWVSHWQPADAAPTWADVLRSGLAFDTTIDEQQVYPGFGDYFPYIHSGVTFIGNAVVVQGGVANGWRLSIPSLIQQVAPVIRPIEGGNGVGCTSYVNDPHVDAPFFCRMGDAGGDQ